MCSVDYLFPMLQLHEACLISTNWACEMPFNTISTQILICWKVINDTKYHCMELDSLLLVPIKHINPVFPQLS